MQWAVFVVFLAYELFLVGAAVYVVTKALDTWAWNRRHRREQHGRH